MSEGTEYAAGRPEPPRRTVATRDELGERPTQDLVSEVVNRARYLGKAEQPAGSSRTGDPQRAREELVEAESVLRDRLRELEAGPSSDARGHQVTDLPPNGGEAQPPTSQR